MAAIHQQLSATVPQETRDKIDRLRKELDATNSQAAELAKTPDLTKEYNALAIKSRGIANELNSLLTQVDQFQLQIANALWGEKTYPFRQAYLDTINQFYQTGGVFPVDLSGDPEGTRKQINAWVEKQTKDRIRELIPPGALDGSQTSLVLTNAIYFKGQWAEVFSEDNTKPGNFTLANGTKARVPMMSGGMASARYGAFKADGTFFNTPAEQPNIPGRPIDERKFYPDQGGFLMLELPYKGKELSMVIIVPRAAAGLALLERRMTARNLNAWIRQLQERSVEVFVPKFKLETAYKMSQELKAMGMARAFSGAQFDGICASPDPKHALFISEVFHKAFVEVNEQGTEAAAATAVLTAPGAPPPPTMVPFTPTFRADKPFLFLIRDRQSGCILFLGRVINPQQA
jgi:serine protease inhibitor